MRKSKIINIEGVGEITVKEASPFAVYKAGTAKNRVEAIKALALECIDLSEEKMENLYASEVEQLIDAFMEVNNSFLAIADKLGLKPTLIAIVVEISKILPPVFADLYKQVMAKLPGITAGLTS